MNSHKATGNYDEQAKKSRDLIANFINELTDNYSIDAENITLVGFSQGTILSYAVAVSYPQKIQRVVAMSGYFNSKIAKLVQMTCLIMDTGVYQFFA